MRGATGKRRVSNEERFKRKLKGLLVGSGRIILSRAPITVTRHVMPYKGREAGKKGSGEELIASLCPLLVVLYLLSVESYGYVSYVLCVM